MSTIEEITNSTAEGNDRAYIVSVKPEYLLTKIPKRNIEKVEKLENQEAVSEQQEQGLGVVSNLSENIEGDIELTSTAIATSNLSNIDDEDMKETKDERHSRNDKKEYKKQNDHVKAKRKRGDLRPDPTTRLCLSVNRGEPCTIQNCTYVHDGALYLASKLPDISEFCYNFATYGYCSSGLTCRFGNMHIDRETNTNMKRSDDDGGVVEKMQINVLKKEVQTMLRKKNYTPLQPPPPVPIITSTCSTEEGYDLSAYAEKVKLVDFSNKIYIAPLTTNGNLPFRRIMKDFGADITCGEMALASNLEQGQPSEWALLRRHSSENCYGVQVAGSFPDQMKRIARVLEHETQTDFVDLNCGCPIDIICNKGCGSALLTKPTRLLEIVSTMSSQLNRSLTVKIRTGWTTDEPNAHKLIPMLQKAGNGKLAAIMVHGRSRLQRYHKAANWEYILEAAKAQNPSLPLVPIIGNGDILTVGDWQSHQHLMRSQVDDAEIIGLTSCAMLGRGALIKPWLPQELKTSQDYDISSTERLDILKKFVNYGLDHWGSDQQGVNTTRRFLLEWLSFLYRYVPIGILVHTQGMQQRPPRYFGRNDLETLLSSPLASDWVKISELLLGTVPDGFAFEPKHKSNAYEGESNG